MKKNSLVSVFFISLGSAILTSFMFVLILYFYLPASDEAKKEGLLCLVDPFVLMVSLPVALAAGAVSTPVLYYSLRYKGLKITWPILQGLVVVAIFLTMPFNPISALLSSVITLWCGAIIFGRLKFADLSK